MGRKLDLPYQMEGKRTYQGITVCSKEIQEWDQVSEMCFDVNKASETFQIFRLGEKVIRCRITDDKVEKIDTKCFDCDIIKHGICIRTRKQGDYITIHPDGRTQKLKSYFINEKIPREQRDQILLVADGNHILWIVGYRINPVYEVKTNTKHILEIQIDEGESYGRKN